MNVQIIYRFWAGYNFIDEEKYLKEHSLYGKNNCM